MNEVLSDPGPLIPIRRTSEELDDWTVSPSQIEKVTCERAYAFRYVARMESPTNASAETGSATHTVLEEYLKDGTLPDQSSKVGEIATAGLHLLPPPGTTEIERTITFASPITGIWYTGRVDYSYRSPTTQRMVVGDHKTTSDFKWMKTENVLRKDPQALVYAAHSLLETGEDSVELEWTYYRTRGAPQSRQIRVILTAKEVQDAFPAVEERAKIALRILRETTSDTILDLPPNLDMCSAFGGCPYQHVCNISISERLQSHMNSLPPNPSILLPPGVAPAPPAPIPQPTQDLMARLQGMSQTPALPQVGGGLSVLEQLRARAAEGATPPPVAPPAPVAPPVVIAPPVVVPAPPAPVAAPTPQPGTWFQHTDGQVYYPHPDGTFYSVDQVRASGGKDMHGAIIPGSEIFASPLGAPGPVNPPEQSVPTVPAAPAPPPLPKAGPGRPKKSAVVPPPVAPNPAPFGAPAAPTAEGKPIRILLIDASLSGGSAEEAENLFFAPSRHALNAQQNVSDYRTMEYGKGAGLFCAGVNALLCSSGPWDIVTVDTRSYDAQQALSLLIAASQYVIRGR